MRRGPSISWAWPHRPLGGLRLATRLLVALGLFLTASTVWAQPAMDRPETLKDAKKKDTKKDGDEVPEDGAVQVRVSEPGAAIVVDGESKGTSPLTEAISLAPGEHEVEIRKAGFQTAKQTVTIEAGKTASIDIKLVSAKGKIKITVEGGANLRVLIDGKDVGPAPYEAELDAGSYEIAGVGDGVKAPSRTVEVEPGDDITLTLKPGAAMGKLEVRIDDGKGRVLIDGEEVGEGNWSGELTAGPHELRVEREGYDPVERDVDIAAGDVRSESVKLSKAAKGDLKADSTEKPWSFDGLYGGFALNAMVSPTGSGNTLQDACDTVGATTCEGGTPLGGALTGYIGYGFAPVGLELYMLGSADVYEPSAGFDGLTQSEINPLLATPARQEDFIFLRVGGGGAVRVRMLWPFGIFRLTTAVGAGLVYRQYFGSRDTVADDGRESRTVFDEEVIDDISAAFSFELAGHVAITDMASFAFGLNLWLENATDVKTQRKNQVRLAGNGLIPSPQATPPYDAALNTQFFLSPFLGFHFGP